MTLRFNRGHGVVLGGTSQVFRIASNVAQAVDRRMPEAVALAGWIDQDRVPLGLPDGQDFAVAGARKPLPAANWRRVRAAITRA